MDALNRTVRTPSDVPPMPEGGCGVHVHGRREWVDRLARALNAHYGIVIDGTTLSLGALNRETLSDLLPELSRAGFRVSVMGPQPKFALHGPMASAGQDVPPAESRMDFYVEKVSEIVA